MGSVGDAYDNAMAKSFVDSFKTDLVADRVFTSRSQHELVVEYISWFNNDPLHESLGDIPPVKFEALHLATAAELGADSDDASSAAPGSKAADALSAPRLLIAGAAEAENDAADRRPPVSARRTGSLRRADPNPDYAD